MKKTILLTIAVILIALFVTGCEEPEPVPVVTEGKCILSMTEDKTLVSEVNSTVVEYLYKATPQFSGAATGSTAEWTHLSYGGTGTIGLLTQGKWKFELRGINSVGSVVTTGSKVEYIDAGKDNVIEIQMSTDPTIGKGSISYTVWTQNVSETGTKVTTYQRVSGTTTWTKIADHSNTAQENVRFNGKASNLQAGFYDVLFLLFDKSGAALGGEQIGVQVVAGHNTAISGIVEPSNEIGLDVTIKSMGYVHGLLAPQSGITVEGEGRNRTAYIERGDTVTFTWNNQADASSLPTEWIWALDGEVISGAADKSYSVSFDTYGDHDLSVIGIRRDKNGVAWDAGSAVIKIVVVRHICDVTFKANGGFYSDGTDVCVISQDTTDPEDREIPGGQPYDGFSPQRSGYILTGWRDAETKNTVVTIAGDGTVTFLNGYLTKKETRTLEAIWTAGTFNLTVIWGERVDSKNYSSTDPIDCGEKLTILDPNITRPGFTFLNYTTEDNGRGEELTANDVYRWGTDMTVYANWEYNEIKVNFYKSYSDYSSGKSAYKNIIVGADLKYGSLPQPLRQGKVFKGWADPNDIDPTKYETVDGHRYLTKDALKPGASFVTVNTTVKEYNEHSLVAVWSDGEIKISFDYADATLTSAGQANINQFSKDGTGTYYKLGALGTMYGALPFTGIETTVRTGWEFMGWYDSPSYSMRIYDVSAVSTMEDHTLYGKWEGQRLTLSFNTGTSETFPTKYVRYNNHYGTLPEPTRYGYKFDGWFYNGKKIESDTYVEYNGNHTLTAKWTAKTNFLTVNPNGGTWTHPTDWTLTFDKTYAEAVNGSAKLGDSSTASKLKNPTRYGYDFAGWYENPAGTGNAVLGTKVYKSEDPQSIYAIWTAHKHRLKFYYWYPGETTSTTSYSDYIAFDSTYGTLPSPTFLGYTFSGWYTEHNGTTKVSSSDRLTVDKDVEVHGAWSIVKINVSFYDGGEVCRDAAGTAFTPKQLTWGQTFGDLGTPYKKGYRFTGSWTIVGQMDSNGNPITITSSTKVTQLADITLSPVWEPLDIFVAIPYNAESTSGGTVTSADWSSYAYRAVTFGNSFNTAKEATVASGGAWTKGNAATLPTWSRLGYYQDGWKLIVPGTSVTEINSTAMLWDYNNADSVINARVGSLNPANMVWLVPNWKLETYQITFVNKFYDGSTISNATSAPGISSRTANYMMTLGAAMESEDESTWAPEWTGYACVGFYADEALTQKLSPSSVFGTDIPLPSTQLKIYAKWMKSYTEYSYSTNDATRYPDNSPQVMFKATELFSGSSNGLVNGTPGWYVFSGVVDDIDFSSTKVRVGTSDIKLRALTNTSSLRTTVTKSWTAPVDMHIHLMTYQAPHYTYTLKCSKCGGQGYVNYVTKNEHYKDDGVDEYYYVASEMYDFCPNGCLNWTSGSWTGEQECNDTVRDVRWVTCPNCKGDPSSKNQAISCTGTYTEKEQVQTGSHKEPCGSCMACTVPDSALGGAGRPPCANPITVPDYTWQDVTHTYDYIKYKSCYCNKFGRPGQVPLAGYAKLGEEYGDLQVLVNDVIYVKNTATSRSAYESNGGSMGTKNVPVSRTIGGCFSGSDPGTLSPIAVREGDVVKITATLPASSNANIIVTEDIKAKCSIYDDADEFTAVSLGGAGRGNPYNLEYNYFNQIAGKYATTNGTSITDYSGTKYYKYTGTITHNSWTIGSATPYMTVEENVGEIRYSNVDTSKTNTIKIVKTNGTVVTGSLQSSADYIIWTDGNINLSFTKSEGGTETYNFNKRFTGESVNDPVQELSFSVWLK